MRGKVRDIVIGSIKDTVSSDIERNEITDETGLAGSAGMFDSMALITLITEIERRLGDEIGVAVSIADENAFSQEKSPFRNVDALVEHILKTLEKK